MEVLKDRARDTYEQLKEAMVTDYQRQVMKLRQRRQDEYAAWLKEIENSKPSRLFGDNAVREADIRAAHIAAHRRHFEAKLMRFRAKARPAPEVPEDQSGSLSLSDTRSVGSSEDEDDPYNDVEEMDKPPLIDSWAARLALDKQPSVELPPLQGVRFVAPLAGYTTTNKKALRKRMRAKAGNPLVLQQLQGLREQWPIGRTVGPGLTEAVFSNDTLQGLLQEVMQVTPREQSRLGRTMADAREQQYVQLTVLPEPSLCAACFAALLHSLPNNHQPAVCGPTFAQVVNQEVTEQGDDNIFDKEAAYYVRWESREADTGTYRLCGASGVHVPEPLYGIYDQALKAAQKDDHFFPLLSAGPDLRGLRVTVSVIHSLELTNEPTDFVMGRHGLLLLFRDRRDNRQWSSCLLPDVVSRLACKERALQVLVRKSGYQGKVHEEFWSRRMSCLFRLEASSLAMDYDEYADMASIDLTDDSSRQQQQAKMRLAATGRVPILAAVGEEEEEEEEEEDNETEE